MIHQPAGGARGQASDIEIAAKEVLRSRDMLNRVLSEHTGKPLDQIAQDSDRDYYMTAEEARDYGIMDDVVVSKKADEGSSEPG
jgi:ATP-dependent Clp protease protease subunit